MSDNKNLELWEKVSKTDTKYAKKVNVSGKPSFTNIDTYYQMQTATSMWGEYGNKWGLKNLKYENIEITDTNLLVLHCEFYYPNGDFEITNSIKLAYKTSQGYVKIDDEAYKKIETNTISKSLSRLGFNVDVYLGMFEDNRYIEELRKEEAKALLIDSKELQIVSDLILQTETDMTKFLKAYKVEKLTQLTKNQYKDAINKLETKLGVEQ